MARKEGGYMVVNIIKKLKDLQDKLGLSQAKVAKQIGINAGALSSWVNGTYNGNNEELEEKIIRFIEVKEQTLQSKIKNVDFCKTSIAERVYTAASLCQTDNEIGIIYGASGLGKTTSIKEYAKRNNGVIIIEADESYTSKIIIHELYEKLGLTGQMTVHKMKKEITKKLKDSGWLVIVDEAEHLKVSAFTTLRRLHDKSDYSFGILFIGLKKLYLNLLKLKGDFEYVTNRIGYCFALEELTIDDVELIVSQAIPNRPDLCKRFFELTGGNARILVKLLKRTLRLASSNEQEVDETIIKKAIQVLIT